MELCCKLLGLSDVAWLDTMMCYLLTTQHILECQVLRNVYMYQVIKLDQAYKKITSEIV